MTITMENSRFSWKISRFSWKISNTDFKILLPKNKTSVPRYQLIIIINVMHAQNTFRKVKHRRKIMKINLPLYQNRKKI